MGTGVTLGVTQCSHDWTPRLHGCVTGYTSGYDMLPASKPSYSTGNSGYASGYMGKQHAEAHAPTVSVSVVLQRSPNRKVLPIVHPSPGELCSAGMSMHMSLPPKWRCLPVAPEMHKMQPCIEGLNRTQAVRVPIGEYVPRPRHIPRIIKQTGVQCPITVSDRKIGGSNNPSNISRWSRVRGPGHRHTEALVKDVPEVVEVVGESPPICSMSSDELDSGCTNCCLPVRCCSCSLPGSQRGIVAWVSGSWQGGRFL